MKKKQKKKKSLDNWERMQQKQLQTLRPIWNSIQFKPIDSE